MTDQTTRVSTVARSTSEPPVDPSISDGIVLTKDERAALRALERLAKRWPKSLWLFSASGSLSVMRCLPDGSRAFRGEGVDQSYVVGTIAIPNDGGDW